MPEEAPSREQLDRFIVDKIDTVPQLEALLMLWRSGPRSQSKYDIARELYISPERAETVLVALLNTGLIVAQGAQSYELNLAPPGRERMLTALDDLYRRELVRVTNLIHDKAPRAVRDFAQAFHFKKKEDE